MLSIGPESVECGSNHTSREIGRYVCGSISNVFRRTSRHQYAPDANGSAEQVAW